jgi:ABC-type uncharacterized transport system fused permease/ATPase subunit
MEIAAYCPARSSTCATRPRIAVIGVKRDFIRVRPSRPAGSGAIGWLRNDMDGELNARLVTTATFLGKLWRLTVPYWWTQETADVRILGRVLRVPERWIARALLAVVLSLNVIIVWILKLANDWNARFYNALEQKNVDAFWGELRYFVVIATLFILVAVYRLWFRQMLQIRWRRWLTDTYYREWLRTGPTTAWS